MQQKEEEILGAIPDMWEKTVLEEARPYRADTPTTKDELIKEASAIRSLQTETFKATGYDRFIRLLMDSMQFDPQQMEKTDLDYSLISNWLKLVDFAPHGDSKMIASFDSGDKDKPFTLDFENIPNELDGELSAEQVLTVLAITITG